MTLSPFEVERQEFGRSVLGYKRRDVDAFLNEVRGTLVGLWQERADLREDVERLSERVARFTALEEQLKNTLLLAQDSAEKACEQARRESELVLREAGQKAREIVHAAHDEKQRLEVTLQELQSAELETRARFSALAQAVLSHLDDGENPTGLTGKIKLPEDMSLRESVKIATGETPITEKPEPAERSELKVFTRTPPVEAAQDSEAQTTPAGATH